MSKRVRICSRSELPRGQMLAISAVGTPPLAAFDVDGDVFVTSNVCTHNVAVLTDGFFEGDVIECPLHGGCFNVKTGEATQFPCEKPLRTFPVFVEHDQIFVEIED